MDEEFIRSTFVFRGNLLLWKSTGLKVPRVSPGKIRLKGKLWRVRDIIAVLLKDLRDGRNSSSFEMAREFPDMIIRQKDAPLLGLTIYRTGKPCKYGHKSWRFVSSGACVACRGLLT